MLCLGILAGSIWGLMRFPTTFAAASEADRQLGLSDLLGTILLAGPSDDPWHRAIAAMAEERCSRLHPRDLIVAKLGFRAWSGVGLSAALLMTLSLLSAHPSDLRADATDAIDAPPDAVALADPQISSDALRLAPFQDSRPGGKGVDANSDRSFEEDQQADGAANAAGTENHAGMNGASDSGNGEGLSVTKGSFSSQDPSMKGSDVKSAGHEIAGGGSGEGDGSGKSNAGMTSAHSAAKQTPTWHAEGNSQASGQASANQNVPDWAADLVRGYFQRD
jgi:hypothetical protein